MCRAAGGSGHELQQGGVDMVGVGPGHGVRADEAAEASLPWLEKRKPRFAASYTADGAERRGHEV